MRVAVDGIEVEVAEDATILDAVRAARVEIPTLCFDPRLSVAGSCRTCLVAVEGEREPVAACATPAPREGLVRTDEPAAVAAARGALELLAGSLPERALIGPEALGGELRRACELLDVNVTSFAPLEPELAIDDSHPYVWLDPALCIACGRCVRACDEIQGSFALTMLGRGSDAVVSPGGVSVAESDCVACGTCLTSCPTGALAEPGMLDPRPIERTTTTTCGYCGVGCGLDVHVREDEIAAITPNLESPVNRGHACVKGRFAHGFVHSAERLTSPLIRRGGRLVEASWREALDLLGAELGRIVDAHGPDAVAAISSARTTNEENWMAQKLMRVAIGTNNVDNCARICHAPSAAGLTAAFGLAGGTNSGDDLDRADTFLLAGSNPTEAHPVIGSRIQERLIAGARLLLIDPRRIDLARYAELHLRPRPGTNVAVFNGIARELIEQGLIDDEFLAARAAGLEPLRELLTAYEPERVEELSGVPAAQIREAATFYGEDRRRAIVWGLGITEHAHGTDGVRALCNLAILTGSVGTAEGCGANPLRGQNNVQGASDMGAMPDVLGGYQRLADPEVRARHEQAWGRRLRAERGLRIPEMFDAAIAGELKALLVIGEDIAQTDPDSAHVRAAIEACDLVVCNEIFLSETAKLADVVLPAASFLEKDGTFVNFDRRVQRVRPALEPPPGARPDFEIVKLLAAAIGTDLGAETPAQAFAEMASLTPLFAGISHERLDREGALHWPCRSAQESGEATLYASRFETPDGRAQLAAIDYLPPGELPDPSYPIVLITGRRLEHYNSGTMTRRTPNLRLREEELVELSAADAGRIGIADGDRVRVESRRGAVELGAAISDRVAEGEAFMAFHFPEALANALTSQHADETTTCPEYKVSAVRVGRVGE